MFTGEIEFTFPQDRRRPWVVAHEVTHTALPIGTGHSGAFPVRCLRLWRQASGWPWPELAALAAEHGYGAEAAEADRNGG